jgi:hypothetical protein
MPKLIRRIVRVLDGGQPRIITPIGRMEQRSIAVGLLANVVHKASAACTARSLLPITRRPLADVNPPCHFRGHRLEQGAPD